MTNANSPASATAAAAAPAPVWQRRIEGDVHVGSMAADVRLVPGTGSASGEKAIVEAMRGVLDRVRRSIREQAPKSRRA